MAAHSQNGQPDQRRRSGAWHGSLPRGPSIRSIPWSTPAAFRSALSPGETHDSNLAGQLFDDEPPADGYALAEKTYDVGWIRAKIVVQDAVSTISDRSTATTRHAFMRALYRMCNGVGRFFNKRKHCRCVATRYDKARHQLPSHVQNRHNPDTMASQLIHSLSVTILEYWSADIWVTVLSQRAHLGTG